MTRTTRTITLSSDRHFGRLLPLPLLWHVLASLQPIVDRSVSMAFRNRGALPGPRPGWLVAASDVRFVDHRGEDDTVLVLEAPTLGDAASELYAQQELWSTRPDPGLTALDLLGGVVREVALGNANSEAFDEPLLKSLTNFHRVFRDGIRSIRIDPHHREDPSAAITPTVVETAERFVASTPAPQRVRVAGTLDMLRRSTQSFTLKLDDGQEVRGVLNTGELGAAAEHWKAQIRVVVLGRAIYRASGQVLRLDADEIRPAPDEPTFWSRVPGPRHRKLNLSPYHQPQGPKSGLNAILGRWPGDETDEEIQAALDRLS